MRIRIKQWINSPKIVVITVLIGYILAIPIMVLSRLASWSEVIGLGVFLTTITLIIGFCGEWANTWKDKV